MNKPILETIEQDSTHCIYRLSLDISDLNNYERAKALNRFMTTESKVMERVLESDLRHFLRVNGIIPQTMTESALKQAFALLNAKGKTLLVVDRNKKAYDETILGVSNNDMTVLLEDNKYLSIAMEIILKDL